MAAFFVGLSVAVLLALAAGIGLNAVDLTTAQAFYTKYTVPLDYQTPVDGRLDHHAADRQKR